ncbi:MAG: hypothetical protein ABIO92_01455 [Chloroflexia bacterium]
MMDRETTCVTVVLVLAGIALLGLSILITAAALAISLDSALVYEPVLWDRAAIFSLPSAIFGILLILLGSNYFRHRRVLK